MRRKGDLSGAETSAQVLRRNGSLELHSIVYKVYPGVTGITLVVYVLLTETKIVIFNFEDTSVRQLKEKCTNR